MADFGEIPKGRGEICSQRANLPFRYQYRCGQIHRAGNKLRLAPVRCGDPQQALVYQGDVQAFQVVVNQGLLISTEVLVARIDWRVAVVLDGC